MALFSKPPPKKPEPLKLEPKSAIPMRARATPNPVSAREVAHEAQGKKGVAAWPRVEPAVDVTVTGASLIDWSAAHSSIEVMQANPGLCSVLENAALLYAGGQRDAARDLLEEGVESDHDARQSALAWLALFDVLQRANERTSFERAAMQYVVQFERSAPAWEEGLTTTAGPKVVAGGYIPVTGKLSAASVAQVEGLKRAIEKKVPHARLDLASVTAFDDAGARLLANALAYARKHRFTLTLQRPEKLQIAVDAVVKRGKDGGEGAWLLSLELLQFEQKHDAFDDRSIEYAIAFEQSPPSWEPPPMPDPVAVWGEPPLPIPGTGDAPEPAERDDAETLVFSSMSGSTNRAARASCGYAERGSSWRST